MAWRDKFEQEMNRDRLSKNKEQSQKLTGSRFRPMKSEKERGGEGWGGGRGSWGGGEGRGGEGRRKELNMSLIFPGRQMFERDASLALSDARFLTESKRSYLTY